MTNPKPEHPTTSFVPKQAGNRITAQNLSRLARQLGRCGDIHPLTGYVCVTQPHADDWEHMAVQIGGPNDGKVYSTWGGKKRNTEQTKAIPQTREV